MDLSKGIWEIRKIYYLKNYERTNTQTNRGLDIFYFYMPCDFTPKKNFRNPFYNDRRASCNIFDSKHDLYKMKDFGNDDFSGDCFWLVAMVKGLDIKRDFRLILQTIKEDLNLQIDTPKKHSKAASIIPKASINEEKREDKEGRYFTALERNFTEADMLFWGYYGISSRILEKFNVRAIARYESISSQGKKFSFSETTEEPIYAYKQGDCIKLYRPKSHIRFLYGGYTENDYVFGVQQLPNKGDVLFITGGEKDVLSLSAHGFNAICFNSETAHISESILEMLERRFKHIILLYDMDETGIKSSIKILEQNTKHSLLRLELPLKGTKEEKDISDFFALGFSALKLKELIAEELSKLYSQTMFLLSSCEIDYKIPPLTSKK